VEEQNFWEMINFIWVVASAGAVLLFTIISFAIRQWLNNNYISKTEFKEKLDSEVKSLKEDIQRNAEAGIKLSDDMGAQLRTLTSAFINKGASND